MASAAVLKLLHSSNHKREARVKQVRGLHLQPFFLDGARLFCLCLFGVGTKSIWDIKWANQMGKGVLSSYVICRSRPQAYFRPISLLCFSHHLLRLHLDHAKSVLPSLRAHQTTRLWLAAANSNYSKLQYFEMKISGSGFSNIHNSMTTSCALSVSVRRSF